MAARQFLRNHWPAITIGVTAAAIALAAIVMLSNMPPRMIIMATGAEGGAYYELGKRYRAELENEGVKVQLVSTAGSPENCGLLLDRHSKVSVALIQGGTMSTGDSSELGVNIGDVIVEPHDIFGDGVNIAARLESIAEPGRICISSSVYDHVRGKVEAEYLGSGT